MQDNSINSNQKPFVFAPGPVNLHPKVVETLSLPMVHHRTPEFDFILKNTLENLKKIFQTQESCFALTCTGSGGMEALLVNTLEPNDLVLGIDSGKFGERWCEMAQVFGAKLHRMKIPWGEPVKASDISDFLDKNPQTKLVLCQACETSTGVKHPIEEIGAIVSAYPETLFLVDGITALGAYDLPMDKYKIDGLVGGSQKAFMLPTGMSFLSFSKKAWKKIEKNPTPRFYFDIRKEKKSNEKGETFFSSNVSLIRALSTALSLIFKKGLDQHFAEIEKRARFVRHFATRLGYQLYAQIPSESLTALVVPNGLDSQKLRLELEEKYFLTVMGGQDQAKGKILRIGHMGFIQDQNQIDLILGLRSILENAGIKTPDKDILIDEMRDYLK